MTFGFSMSPKCIEPEGQCRLTLKASLGQGIKGRQDVQSCRTDRNLTEFRFSFLDQCLLGS